MHNMIYFIFILEKYSFIHVFTPWNNYDPKSGGVIKKISKREYVILGLKYCYAFLTSFEIVACVHLNG